MIKSMVPVLFHFLTVAKRKFSILYVACILFLLDSCAMLYNTLTKILGEEKKKYATGKESNIVTVLK